MIIVTTRRRVSDDRDFCADWKALPSNKYNPEELSIVQYAYPDSEIPDDFWKKHNIYYVDHQHGNKLVKAYELEDQWNDMQFLNTTIIGQSGTISDSILIQHLTNQVKELENKLTSTEEFLGKYDFDQMVEEIEYIKKNAVFDKDAVDIKQIEDK